MKVRPAVPADTPAIARVLDTNPTRGFYERLGGVACREKLDDRGEVVLREIGYGWGTSSQME